MPVDQLIVETTSEGLLLRPLVKLPAEFYTPEREFDDAEAVSVPSWRAKVGGRKKVAKARR
jgi:hypothetical protein